MASVKEETDAEQSIIQLCARVVSTHGYELQNAIIELSKALDAWLCIKAENGS